MTLYNKMKNQELAIAFRNIHKTYHKNINSLLIREVFANLLKPKQKSENKALSSLQEINFEIFKGETVGIIGKNGSGKSTTLKLIAGICEPTEGEIEINGKVTTMLSLGAGFHPDFTGRENIFLNGTLFGMSNFYLNSKVEDIIAFSELEHKIDEPVRTYSLGMLSRLGFSIAIQTQPEILLIDEILAVGDTSFQQKCLRKFDEIKASGNTTIVLVTHDMEQVKKHCQRAIWIHQGKLKAVGNAAEIVDQYSAQN
jgi:ABC-type polysaccharide/polyol phosphate transport system ATPase subunit